MNVSSKERLVHLFQNEHSKLFFLASSLAISWLPVLFGKNLIHKVSDLAHLAGSANPYFIPQHGWLIYVQVPLVLLSAIVFFLTPGLLLALLVKPVYSLETWVLYGFTISLVLISTAAAIVQKIIAQPLQGFPFALVVIASSLIGMVVLYIKQRRGQRVTIPLHEKNDWITLISMLLVPILILLFLAPKIHWENFNGDGVHAIETARLLLFRSLPFWDATAGDVSSFPGISSMLFAYPMSWFVRLLGVSETSARVPYLLLLPVLFAVIVSIIDHNYEFKLRSIEKWLIWLVLTIFTIVIAYSASYSRYSADLALPAVQDTLFLVFFLGFILADFRRDTGWWITFLVLSFLTLPSGTILAGFWLFAIIIIQRPIPWKHILHIFIAMLAFQVTILLANHLLDWLGLPNQGGEYGLIGLLSRFAFLQWEDWRRFLWIIVPSGFLPVISLLAWKWQDQIGRSFTLVSAMYFAMFFFQAYTVLHYFIPAMVFPLIPFWRMKKIRLAVQSPWALGTIFTGCLAALILSLPQNYALELRASEVSRRISINTGDYQQMDPSVFRSSELLSQVFPYDWDPKLTNFGYRGSPLVWNYYAHQQSPDEVNYMIQPSDEPAPAGMRLITATDEFKLYISNEARWANDRIYYRHSPISSIYEIPRSMIFRSIPGFDRPRIVNMVDVLRKLGLNPDLLLKRLGVVSSP